MTPAPQHLLITPPEFAELANIHTDGISPARLFEITLAVSDRSRLCLSPQWTDDEVMKEIQDAFDRGVEAAESTIDMQKHDTAIRKEERERVLDMFFQKAHSGESGWRYDLKFLSDLEFRIEERGEYNFQCEDIEEILTVFEESLHTNDKLQ